MKYTKSEAGQLAFKTRADVFSAAQRKAFIMFDGNKTVDDVLAMASGVGVVRADIEHMVSNGLLDAPFVAPVTRPVNTLSAQERYAQAWPIATKLTAALGLRGFRLNLAVEAATGYEKMLELLPKIQELVGREKALPLEKILID